jgi:hypothetical protein
MAVVIKQPIDSPADGGSWPTVMIMIDAPIQRDRSQCTSASSMPPSRCPTSLSTSGRGRRPRAYLARLRDLTTTAPFARVAFGVRPLSHFGNYSEKLTRTAALV